MPTTAKGYERLLCWAEGFGPVRCAGIEGTSSYGVGLARHLKAAGISVMEVERPKSAAILGATARVGPHRRRGSSQGGEKAGEALGEPKMAATDGWR